MRSSQFRTLLLAGCAALALSPAFALAQTAPSRTYNIPAQDLGTALTQFGQQSEREIVFSADLTRNRKARAVSGEMTANEALAMLLSDSGLNYRTAPNGSIIVEASDPQSGSAAGDGADQGTVQALIVTAQKREEDIQDVPIAISAFTQEDLTRSQVAGGPDLVTQVPNFTFTKTNFSSYSIQIRGIGTQAISATTDPAVAVAFNNTPFIRNRFFEQEFYDLERVEVLRGPQGTLYGRNATAGVVNIISAKPKFRYEAKLSGDVGNYSSSRFEGMVNIPLVEDKVALRIAGAWTKRDGYATNELSGNPIDGRDLWSTRVSLRIAPTDRINVNLIWEHFQEGDDRLRSGKQLCKKHVISELNGIPVDFYQAVPDYGQAANVISNVQSVFSQGCERASLYSPESFQTPNGLSLPYYLQLGPIGLPVVGSPVRDPYLSTVQSTDLRSIESTVPPDYRAKSDLGELQFSFDLTDKLTLTSETAYSADFVWSLQDFNRFNTAPGTWDTSPDNGNPNALVQSGILSPSGFFCDPQLGCSDRLVAVDVATGAARQFSQEFRIASDYKGRFNFSLGANFLRADSEDKYYVFINSLSMIAAIKGLQAEGVPYVAGQTDNFGCLTDGAKPGNPNDVYSVVGCIYMDPNPIGSLNDQGHNYFLSKNPYKLISYAVFGEAYYNITDNLKITGGLRLSVDKKEAPRVPSWLLAAQSYGYPVAETIEQEWREPTGRLVVDWKPDLSFTDETLVYASYAHGYKAGGANPPRYVYVFYGEKNVADVARENSETRPTTFDPEFVDAFEVGTKNTAADGRLTLNLSAFYYDYKGYQISEIVDRSAFNRNFDATVWGLELEADWEPLENFRLGVKVGYEKTRIADGEQAIDLMDRTAGVEGWSVIRPFPTFASNCILPTALYLPVGGTTLSPNDTVWGLGGPNGGNIGGCELAYLLGLDPGTEAPYSDPPTIMPNSAASFWSDPSLYPGFDPHQPGINNGEGFLKPLGGNELPNAPHWTATVTGDYTLPLANDWLMTLHSDVHWQSQSWWRVFNDNVYDKLHPYFTMNLAAIFSNEERGWNIMAYVKNVTDATAITGAFLNSDDTGLTTNVFLTEPRLYGLRVTKEFTGASWWGGSGGNHHAREPYPLTVELGGQVQRQDAAGNRLEPGFAAGLPAALDTFDELADSDLDWGDGRDVQIRWRPGGPWTVSAGVRFGRANMATRRHAEEETAPACAYGGAYAYICPSVPQYYYTQTNWSDVDTVRHEDHKVVDFSVGKDVGLGKLSRSFLSLGIRYAQFKSTTATDAHALPDWYFPDGWYVPYSSGFVRYNASLAADRDFKGLGPLLNWDASVSVWNAERAGHLDVEWSASVGALFGKHKTSISGQESSSAYELSGYQLTHGHWIPPIGPATVKPISISRSKSVTVPTVGTSVGLSYTIDRVSIGAGYRWERYFDVIDSGDAKARDADRTIDGPYFKIAVGFGG